MDRNRIRCLVGMVCLMALAATAGAAPMLHSNSFLYRYEQDVASYTQDLDTNGTGDFWPTGGPSVTVGGISSFQGGELYRTDFGSGPATSSITRAQFPANDGDYTIEVRAKIRTTGSEGSRGTMSIFWRDPDDSTNITYLSRTGQAYNTGLATATDLGTNDNTDAFHTYRVMRESQKMWVWRDEVLLNPGGTGLDETTVGGATGFFLGDTGTGVGGDWELDYVRLTPGAYAPDPIIPEPMTMLAVGLSVAGLSGYVRKRRRA